MLDLRRESLEMDHGVDGAGRDRGAAENSSNQPVARTGFGSIDAIVKNASDSGTIARPQILTGADFAQEGRPGERLDRFFEELAQRNPPPP